LLDSLSLTLSPGTHLGPYEILAPLGAGGMGEVYRAKDSRLGRTVALKVLPEDFLDDEERKQRFEREARLLATLSHPGIAAIYSFEEISDSSSSSSRHILVMELVEGEDLAQRLANGPLPLEESLSYARQIAEALEAAHEKGVVHRDLKPANIKVTPDGRVKLLDFGLAKIFEGDAAGGSAPSVTHSPTLTARATAAGMILGTAAYMSPEQARGKPLDKRTDVWAFGCVLFEMLTGKRAFEGETVSDTLAAVLLKEPDWSALPEQTPGKIRDLLRKCLRREAKQRLHDIADARLEVEELTAASASSFSGSLGSSGSSGSSFSSPFEEKTPGPSPAGGRSAAATSARGSKKSLFLSWAVAAAFAAAAGALALRAPAPRREMPLVQLELRVPEGVTLGSSMALSPDGRRIAFAASDEKDVERLYVRTLDSVGAQPLAGTEGARFPFWSPDGTAIAFFTADRLARVNAAGGPALTICPVVDGRGGTWSPRGVIVFAPGVRMPLHRVSATGGIPVPVSVFGPKDYTHRWPQILPDGAHFIYLCLSEDAGRAGLRVASLDGTEDVFLASTRGRAVYDAGRLLYVRETGLYAQPFDPGRRKLSGEPALVVDGIVVEGENGWTGLAAFTAAGDGTLVYRRRANPRQNLTWFDRAGKALGTVGETNALAEPFWFADRRRIGITVTDPRTELQDLWQVDLTRGAWTRLTFGPRTNSTGISSPDGRFLYFSSNRAERMGLFRRPLDGSGGDESLLATTLDNYGDFISPDGASLVYEVTTGTGRQELWRLPLAGERKPALLLAIPKAAAVHSSGSPDGKFFAYASDETGRAEVYVQRFPPSGGKWQISTGGGDQPLWRQDGQEIYFLSTDRKLMAVDISLKGEVAVGIPKLLFPIRVSQNGISDLRTQYLNAPDGKRFLVLANADDRQDHPAVVVLNWPAMVGQTK
jgi:eukaryotic-like serine/threonine-protein kinase